MEKKKSGTFIVSIVAVVGIVAIVALFLGTGTSTVVPTNVGSTNLVTADNSDYCNRVMLDCTNNNVDVDSCVDRVAADSKCEQFTRKNIGDSRKNTGGLAVYGDKGKGGEEQGFGTTYCNCEGWFGCNGMRASGGCNCLSTCKS